MARVPSGRRREEAPPCCSADEGNRGVNRKDLNGPERGGRHGVRRNAPTREQMKRRLRRGRRRGRGGLPADLGGGWSRTRGRGRAGAGRPGGGASGRRGCPGTACRSSRSSTSPRASCWVLAALLSANLQQQIPHNFLQELRISFANPKPSHNPMWRLDSDQDRDIPPLKE